MTSTNQLRTSAKWFLPALFSLLVLTSAAQTDPHLIDLENNRCLENAVPTTIGSINCEMEALEAWKAALDDVLNDLKAEETLLDVSLLEESQNRWQAFHQSSVQLYYSYYQKQYQGGTMARVAALTYEKRAFRERVLDLTELYEELLEQ